MLAACFQATVIGLLVSKNEHRVFNLHSDLSAGSAYDDETSTDENHECVGVDLKELKTGHPS